MVNVNANFQYTANFGPVIGQMEQLTRQANVLNNTLQNLDKQSNGLKQNLAGAFASDLGKIGGWNAKMVELTDSVDNFGQSLLKQKLTLKQYAQEAIGSFSKASNAHKLAVREVSREMSQLLTLGKDVNGKQMGMMITPATINLKDLNTQLAVSQKQWSIFNTLVQDGATHLINFGKNTQWAGRQITVGLTVPLTIYGNTVSKIFREVDAELTRFQKVYGGDLMNTTSDATAQMVSDVRQLAVEFSKSMGIAAKDTASLAADLAATGLEGQKLLASIRETTRLAVLGDVSNQDAMKTTLSLQNAFKMSTDELAQSVNFLNAVENQTSLSLQDLTTAIPKAGPVIKALGGDVKDLSLLMVALKEGGISAAEGANALKSGMASLVNPTKKASETAKQYGIDINQIVQANRGQLMPTIVAFQQQLQLLDEFGKAQVIENVFGKYQFARISALFDNLNASASQTNAVLGLMGKSNKELAATAYQEMDTLMNSSSKRFQRAIEGIKAQFISIGGSITAAITPILENVMGKIQKAIEFFNNLPKPVKSFIKVATGLTAIAGPIIMMVGIFSNFLGYIGKGAMGMVNLGRRMAGIPTQKFEMLTDTQIMAQKATEQLANSFDVERTSVERLNQALSIYKQNLAEAISLNPGFLNRQVSAVTTTGNPPKATFQTGGSAWVPGSGNGDKIPAMLEPGEYVVNKKAASQYGPALDHINYNAAPRFQSGGRVPGYAGYSASFPGEAFSFDPSRHLVLANGMIMRKEEWDRVSAEGGRLPVLMRDEVNPYLNTNNKAYVNALSYSRDKQNPFIGPLPQISYQVSGVMRPGGRQDIYGYPFNSKEEASDFSSLNSQRYGGYGAGSKNSNVRRSINDPEQQAFADWIGGHNSSQFRNTRGAMKNQSMAGHRQHILNNISPIQDNISLYRGTVLQANAGEFAGAGYRNLMLALKYNLLDKGIGQEIQWSDLQSFSSIPDIGNYSKFIESWTQPSNTNSRKAADKKLASMDMIPVIFHMLNARGKNGFNISSKAMVQEVMGAPVNEKEWILNKPSGRVSAIHQDIATKNFIVDLMQKGGRVQSHADTSKVLDEWTSGGMKGVRGNLYKYQALTNQASSIPAGIRLGRGTVLNPGLSKELSAEQQMMLLAAIQSGDYSGIIGKELNFRGLSSFSENSIGEKYSVANGYPISRFMENALAPYSALTQTGSLAKAVSKGLKVGPAGYSGAFFDFITGNKTMGINTGQMGIDKMQETILSSPSGRITGVSSDMATKKPIFHIQGHQSGGRIGSAAGGLAFAHIVPGKDLGSNINLKYPVGLDILRSTNSKLNSNKALVNKKDLIGEFNKSGSTQTMKKLFASFAKLHPQSDIKPGFENIIKDSAIKGLSDAPQMINDSILYHESLNESPIKKAFETFKRYEYLSDYRANISQQTLEEAGFKEIKPGLLVSPDGKIKVKKTTRGSGRTKFVDPKTGENLIGPTTQTQRSFPYHKPLLGYLANRRQSGGRVNGYATETATWAKKAAAPKAYAGVLQNIPDWATKGSEYEAIISALRAAGIPEADKLAGFYIQDVLAHINPSTTNENGVYEKVWAAGNLMKDSQAYNVFLETINSRKDVGGLLNPSTVARVAGDSGLPVGVVQAELTKIADGVHPNTANGARVMMSLARLFPSRTKPGITTAVAAGLGARLQGNFYSTLGQRSLPSNLPTTTVRSYDPKGAGAPTSRSQGSRVRSTGLIMPSGAVRQGIVMPNIQSINSAANGSGSKATVKVDGNGNVLSNGIDDMVAHTVTGQPIAVSSKELLAISSGGLIAGVTSPGDEARGNIVHPVGTALMRGKKFEQIRSAAGGMTEPVYDQPVAQGRMDKFAASMSFLTSGVYTLQTALQQFTATTQEGADKFTKMAAATTLAMTSVQGLAQIFVDEGKLRSMQIKSQKMQGLLKPVTDLSGKQKLDENGNPIFAPSRVKAPVSKMSSGMGKLLGVGSKALGFLGGPMGMLATSVAISAVNKGIEMYQQAVGKAKAAGQSMFKDPVEGAKLLGITLKDTSNIAQTYSKIAQGLGMKGTGKGAYDKTYADVVKKDYGDLIGNLKMVLNSEEKRNKLMLTYINLRQKGFSTTDAKDYVKEIARQSGSIAAFNSLNLDSVKTAKDMANQTVASTKALMSSIGKVDKSLLGKYMNTETGQVFDTRSQANKSDTSIGDRRVRMVTEDLPQKLGAGILGSISSLGLNEKQLGEAIAGALKTAYSIAATDPAAANQAGAMIIKNIADGTQAQQDAANGAILEMLKEAGASQGDLGYSFVQGGGLEKMANDMEGKFAGMGPKFANAITSAIQSGNIDLVNEMLANSGGDPSPEAMQAFATKLARIEAEAKIKLEVDIQLEQTKKQLEDIKTQLGKTFDQLIAAKQSELEIEDKRHEKAVKNLDDEAKRLNDKKDILQRNTDYYIKELEREKQAEDYYARQRQTGLSGLKAISQGDVFGLIGAQMEAASNADQFGRDRSMQTIQETADAGQKKLDEDLRNIDNRKAAEDIRHQAEIDNINAEIEFLNKKRSIAVGSAEGAITKIEKVTAMNPSDPGYAAAVKEAMNLANTAGMQATDVLKNVDTSKMTKEQLADFNKVQKDLGLSIDTFTNDTTTALGVIGKDGIEPIVKNIQDSLGATGDILSQVVSDLNKPVAANSVIAKVEALAGIDTGAANGTVNGTATAGNGPLSTTNTTPTNTLQNNLINRGGSGRAIAVNGFANGGLLSGPGTGTSDSIPARLSNGEFVMSADSVKKYGVGTMNAINAKKFATGGFVGSTPPSAPKYNIPSAGVSSNPSPVAQMASGGMAGSSMSHTSPTQNFNFNGAGMDMVMHHVNKAVGGRINSNSRRIG